MSRNLVFAAALLLALLVLVAYAPTKAVEGHAWTPLLESQFRSFSVDAGGESRKAWNRVASTPSPSILPKASVTPRPTVRPTGANPPLTSAHLAGQATWYAYHQGQAAAARELRAFLGKDWRGSVVRVCHGTLCLHIRLTDYEASAIPNRLIDLDTADWAALCGDLSRGVCEVRVSR